jgi:hypothetical protein
METCGYSNKKLEGLVCVPVRLPSITNRQIGGAPTDKRFSRLAFVHGAIQRYRFSAYK